MKTVFALLAELVYSALGLILTLGCMVGVWNVLYRGKEFGPGMAIVMIVALVVSYRFFKAAKAARAIRKWRLKPEATIYERYGYYPDGPPTNPAANEMEGMADASDGSASGQHAPSSPLSGYLGTLNHRFELWCRGLSDTSAKLFVGGSIALVGAVALFLLREKPTYMTVFIHGPKENVFIDGEPVSKMEKYNPLPPFANGFSVIEQRPSYEITIRDGDQVILRKKVSKGAYVINATTDSWVAIESLIYKPSDQAIYESINSHAFSSSRKLLIEPSGLGVYQMSGEPEYYRPVDFDSDPPSSVPSKSSSPITHIVKFHTGKVGEDAR